MILRFAVFFLFSSISLYSVFVGNFASPIVFEKGLFTDKPHWVDFRAGYLYDHTYKAYYEDLTKLPDSVPSHSKMTTQSALMTLTFFSFCDLYSWLGRTSIQIDKQIYSKNQFSWGCGGKIFIFRYKQLTVGLDGKYFRTKVKPSYFVIDHERAPLITHFSSDFQEIQGGLGFSYITDWFVPYLGMTYLHSDIKPVESSGLYRLPSGEIQDFIATNSVNRKHWGLVLGTSLVYNKQVAIQIETRFFDQNGWNFTGELRF